MTQLPYIKYLETLVAGRLSASEVHDKLLEVGLDLPAPAVQIVYDHLSLQKPDYFKDKTKATPVDMEWLVELKIDKMFGHVFKTQVPAGTLGIQGSFNIIEDPLMYRLITSLALARITDEDIELIVNGKFNISYAAEDIQEFLHYFFSVKDWDLSEKKAYVATIEDKMLKSAYNLALKGDKDYLVWKLGASPEQGFDVMLRDMMTDAYFNFKEQSRMNPDTAQKWGTLAIRLTDRLEKLEKDTDNKKNLFDEIKFQIKEHDTSSDRKRHLSELNK